MWTGRLWSVAATVSTDASRTEWTGRLTAHPTEPPAKQANTTYNVVVSTFRTAEPPHDQLVLLLLLTEVVLVLLLTGMS